MPIEVFGAGAVQTAYVSYEEIDLTSGSVTLVWPNTYVNLPYTQGGITYTVLAASMNVNTPSANTYTVTLPDARQSSVGSNFIITNIGLSSFRLLKSDNTELIVIPATEEANSYWVQLTDNSDSVGSWTFVQFGAGTSSAVASVLAGNGLVALGGTLNSNTPVVNVMTDYTVSANDRAKLLVWKNGDGTITLPAIGDVPSGFFVSINISGMGAAVTISGSGANINGQANISLYQYYSLTVISDGSAWWTLGLGQNALSSNFAPGDASNPSITFSSDDTTGFYYSGTPVVSLNATVSGVQVLGIVPTGLQLVPGTSIQLPNSTNTSTTALSTQGTNANLNYTSGSLIGNLLLTQDATTTYLYLKGTNGVINTGVIIISTTSTTATIQYNDISAIVIDNAGNVTLPAAPLPIGSGGTGAATQQAAINALMPTTGAKLLSYYNGTNWVPTAGTPTDGFSLKLVGGVPTWSA